jgi:hypothetical protein
MKRKYADMYYSVKKEEKGWTWSIYFNYKDKEPAASSFDDNGVFSDDKYSETETGARMEAIHAIQDHYS